jgi:hypothetical protein
VLIGSAVQHATSNALFGHVKVFHHPGSSSVSPSPGSCLVIVNDVTAFIANWWCCGAAGGLTEGLLMQLGQLPRIKATEGLASDVDTDKDIGSEATDLGSSDMDIF